MENVHEALHSSRRVEREERRAGGTGEPETSTARRGGSEEYRERSLDMTSERGTSGGSGLHVCVRVRACVRVGVCV